MDTPMHVGVVVLVVMAKGIQNRDRLLRGGRVIEVHQWLPMNLLVQNRKIGANPGSKRFFLSKSHCSLEMFSNELGKRIPKRRHWNFLQHIVSKGIG